MFSWIGIVEALLKLATSAYSQIEHEKGLKEGEDRNVLRMLLELQKRTKTYKAISARVANLTPEAVIAELDKAGDFRD